jgi:hypothetical protein
MINILLNHSLQLVYKNKEDYLTNDEQKFQNLRYKKIDNKARDG